MQAAQSIFFHNCPDSAQHIVRHGIVFLHGRPNHLGKRRIIPHQEPGVNADAVAAHTGAGLQNIHPWVHIAQADNFIYIQPGRMADCRQLIGKGNIYRPKGVFRHLCHFGGANIRHCNVTAAKSSIQPLHTLADFRLVGTNDAIVFPKLCQHIARNNAFRRMNQENILPRRESRCLRNGINAPVDGSRGNRGFYDNYSALGANTQNLPNRCQHSPGIHFPADLFIRGWDGNHIEIRALISGGKGDSRRLCLGKQFLQPLLPERHLTGV